ncbi:WD-40 repeat-containing [Brachionus plicatilis]|uniref:WD-40 repeat-containing n=1 Tax=Brachionus plicatilis TaxID=10195 RepID=A0A3M7S4Q6_BRAPC|nr:WD-40 repeat-containing [Brachionus plicatilis]
MSNFGLKYKYCLDKIFDRCISKIEEFDDNEKLLISTFGSKMKTGRFNQLKFDLVNVPEDYVYFILNKKKDIILAIGKKQIGIYLVNSKLFYPTYFSKSLSFLALIVNTYIILSSTEANFIEIKYWDNFFPGSIINVKHLVGHTDGVIYLCVVGDDYLLSGSRDATIKYWKISTLECIRTFVGHKGFVTSLMFLKTGECFKTLIGHKNLIYDIQETRNAEIVSLGMYAVLKFWNIETGTCMLSLSSEINDRWSCFRILESGKLVTGSQAGKIQIWSDEQIVFEYQEKICQRKKSCNIL